MTHTYLANACPESPLSRDRTITPLLTADGHPRVRVSVPIPGSNPTDLFPNAARDMAAALTKHANEAEAMAKAEAERKARAAKPHPFAERDPIRTDCWIWYADREFHYRYDSGHGRSFKPAKDYTRSVGGTPDIGAPTPERIDLWCRVLGGNVIPDYLHDMFYSTPPQPKAGYAARRAPDPTRPNFEVWCEADGTFKFTYYGRAGAVKFVPGHDYLGDPHFNPTPANVALWTELARNAGIAFQLAGGAR